jgi:hypothetical protein
MISRRKPKELGRKPVALPLPTTKLTLSHPGLNLGLCGEKPLPNDLSYGMIRAH